MWERPTAHLGEGMDKHGLPDRVQTTNTHRGYTPSHPCRVDYDVERTLWRSVERGMVMDPSKKTPQDPTGGYCKAFTTHMNSIIRCVSHLHQGAVAKLSWTIRIGRSCGTFGRSCRTQIFCAPRANMTRLVKLRRRVLVQTLIAKTDRG